MITCAKEAVATNRREPREYAPKILRSARDAGMTQEHNQLGLIYNIIDVGVRAGDLRSPRQVITVNDMLMDLDE